MLQRRSRENILIGYPGPNDIPLYIKDDAIAGLVARLRGVAKQGAARLAVEAELNRNAAQVSVKDRLRKLWAEHPMPPRTGRRAGKAFFDDLSGGL